MIAPLPIYRRTLTGRVRGRRTWRNKLLMQVEVRCDELHCWPRPTAGGQELQIKGTHYEWRDAKVDDMLGGIYSLTPNTGGNATERSEGRVDHNVMHGG